MCGDEWVKVLCSYQLFLHIPWWKVSHGSEALKSPIQSHLQEQELHLDSQPNPCSPQFWCVHITKDFVESPWCNHHLLLMAEDLLVPPTLWLMVHNGSQSLYVWLEWNWCGDDVTLGIMWSSGIIRNNIPEHTHLALFFILWCVFFSCEIFKHSPKKAVYIWSL